ncbi:hypothetical protein PFISCL1PPCAC_14, partial [Pristionchus fissidentatus]
THAAMPTVKDASDEIKDAAVAQVRAELGEWLHPRWNTKYNILRWVQDHDYNVEETIDILRKHLKYRRERFLDEDMRGLQRSIVCEDCHPLTVVGSNRREKGDRLLIFEQPGKVDIDGLMKSVQPTQFLHHMFRGVEMGMRHLNAMEEERGEQCYFHYIFDMEGLKMDPSYLKIATGPFRVSWELVGFQYREFIDKFIVLNAPTFLHLFIAALYPFVPAKYRCEFDRRVVICGKNYKEYLLSIADPECLPEKYGGTMPDVDVVRSPCPVPKSYYWKPPPGYPKPEQLHRLTIPPGKFRNFDFFVEPWTTITFFTTNDSDVQLWLFYAKERKDLNIEGVAEQVLPTATLTGVPAMDLFDYVAERGGYYQVRMKNHSTWFKNAHPRLRMYDQNKEEIHILDKDEIKWIKQSWDIPTDIRLEDWAKDNPNNPLNKNAKKDAMSRENMSNQG